MIFGNVEIFAIECYRENERNERKHVFGRMCIWVQGIQLGNINESSCMLNVSERPIQNALSTLECPFPLEFENLEHDKIFKKLSDKLFSSLSDAEDRTIDGIIEDSRVYGRYNFLTNGGESFDFEKSFIVPKESTIIIMFEKDDAILHCFEIDKSTFQTVLQNFLQWLNAEKNA